MLRLPLAFDLPHHKRRVALHHHIPRAVLERQKQAEYQRVVLSDVVGSLVVTLDVLVGGAVAQLDSAGSHYRAGTLPAAVEMDSRQLRHLGKIIPMIGDGPINALSMQSSCLLLPNTA